MKLKYLPAAAVLLLMAAAAAGCSQKTPPAASAPPATSAPSASAAPDTALPPASPAVSPSPSDSGTEEALSDYYALLKTTGNEKAALDTLRPILSGLPADDAAAAVLDFEKYQNDAVTAGTLVGKELTDLLRARTTAPYNEKALADPEKVKDPALKKDLEDLYARGYKIIIPEGNYQAVIDYSAYKPFETYLPKDLAAYIEIMAAESDSRLAEDGGIIIPIQDVYKRTRATESFLQLYPTSAKTSQIKDLYGNYLDAYIFGFDNTPAFDYSTKKLNREWLDSYQLAAAESTDSALAGGVSAYLKVLKDNGYKLTKAVADYRSTLEKTLKNAPAGIG